MGLGQREQRILVAERSGAVRQSLVEQLVRMGHLVAEADDGRAALSALREPDGPAIAVLNHGIGSVRAVDIVRTLRRESERYVYFLMVGEGACRARLIEALHAGADDYLHLPVDPEEFAARIEVAVRTSGVHEQLLAVQERLRDQAMHDSLTGLANRRAMDDHFVREIARAERGEQPVSVALFDLDRFKRVNDRFGHATGDRALKVFAEVMRGHLRPYDMLARIGGEEFVLLMPGLDADAALVVADRLRRSVEREVAPAAALVRTLTVSVGISTLEAGESCRPEVLLGLADTALYEAKRAGRNRVQHIRDTSAARPDRSDTGRVLRRIVVPDQLQDVDDWIDLAAPAEGAQASDSSASASASASWSRAGDSSTRSELRPNGSDG